jgi:3-ketosteroid 9alpha-monooxygenase subunit B
VRDHGYHPLRVAQVVRETDDASSFVLEVPEDLREAFAYSPGQFCTFRVEVDGEPFVRCYSMCSAPALGEPLQVTVKRVPDGVVSNWMNDHLAAGDVIDVMPPAGFFQLTAGDGDVVAFAGGSGITPVFSIVKTALATTSRRVRLLYANRDRESTIFRDAIDGLDRLEVVHHLDVEQGFVDAHVVRPFVGGDADYYICGPTPFMDVVEAALLEAGVDEGRIHIERFTAAERAPLPEPDEPAATEVTIELDGKTASGTHRAGTTILQTARALGMSPPFSCESGSCATCMAKLVEGSASMFTNNALTPDEVDEGWVLTCQAVPTAPVLHVIYGYEG